MKAEAEAFMSKDEEIMVENNGEIDDPNEEKSVLDGSINGNLKVRRRGRQRKNHEENKNQGCGETGESEGREKGFDNDLEKEKSKVETEGWRSRVRQSSKMAMEKMGKMNSENNTDDEDERVSKRRKKRSNKRKKRGNKRKKNNEVGAEIAEMEDEKTNQRRSSRNKGTGEAEGKELNDTVTKTRVGMKRDENVGRIWKFHKLISLKL